MPMRHKQKWFAFRGVTGRVDQMETDAFGLLIQRGNDSYDLQ
jgi:hypothetical protein